MKPQPFLFDSILKDALEIPMDQRLEFVRAEAVGNPALLSELELAVKCANESALATSDTTKAYSASGDLPVFSKGERIGTYVVEEPLGQGGFGTVYKCHDESADRQVAIKVFSHDCDSDEPSGSRFEAKANAKVRHPQIAKFLHTGSFESKNADYLVYEFIDGPTLKTHLMQSTILKPETAVSLILGLCRPLAAIHESGLTHRDLKPANVLLDSNLEPHLLDFGLAISEAEQINMPDHIAGTLAYMAPEQLAGNVGQIDGRTDIWAIGVILYELLTGALPFKDKNTIAQGHFRPPSMRAQNIPLGLDLICKHCFAVDVNRRFNSVAALVEALNNTCQPVKEPQNSKPIALKESDENNSAKQQRLSFSPHIIGVSVVVLTIITTLVLVLKPSTQRSSPNNESSIQTKNNSESSTKAIASNPIEDLENIVPLSNSSERDACLWAFGRGANISINDWEELRPGMSLPEGNFSLVAVDLEEREFGDKDLQMLSNYAVPNLQSIDLSATNVSDQGMEYLLRFRQLNDLTLRKTQVGDEGMKFVAQIPNLLNLYIDETRVTDKGIESLSQIKFRNLHLQNLRGVTDHSAKILSEIDSLEENGLSIDGTAITKIAIEKFGLDK